MTSRSGQKTLEPQVGSGVFFGPSPSFKLDSSTILYSGSATFGNAFCCGRIAGLKEVMIDLADVVKVFAQQSKISG